MVDSIPSGLDENSDVGVRPVDVKPFLIEPVSRRGWMRINPWKNHLMKPPLFDMSMVWSFWYWWWYTMMHVHICDVWRHQHHPILVSPGISDKRNTPMNNERLFKGLGCTLLQDIICGITFSKYFCGSCSCGFLRLENWPGSRNQRWCKMTFRGVGVSARWKQPAVTGGEAEREWQSHLTFLMAWKPGQKFLRLSLPRIADSKNNYKKKDHGLVCRNSYVLYMYW